MKRLVLVFAATMIMGCAFAQGNKDSIPQLTAQQKTEMAQRQTDRMVKQYGLDDTQAKKLLALNEQYAGKMGGPRGGMHGHGMGKPGGNGQRPDFNPSDTTHQHHMGQRPAFGGNFGRGPQMSKEMLAQMKADREAYETALSKIMTSAQYKKYQEEKASREQRKTQADNDK
jgi:hypothetical protein